MVQAVRDAGHACRAFPSTEEFLRRLDRRHGGCLILSAQACGSEPSQVIGALRLRGGAMPVLLVSDIADVNLAVSAMKAGAAEFLVRPLNVEALLAAVCHALQRAESVDARRRALEVVNARRQALTQRERQVLAAVVEGESSKQIGQRLGISPRTVEIHRAHVMTKMRASRLPDLIRMVALADLAA